MQRRLAIAAPAVILAAMPAAAEEAATAGQGLVTVQSRHGLEETLRRFEAAVRDKGWIVFTRIDHAAAAEAAGLQLAPRVVVIFGNPSAGTPAMAAHPTLALDLPLRVLVWEDAGGRIQVTRNSGAYMARQVYPRHGMALPAPAEQGMETLLAGLVQAGTA